MMDDAPSRQLVRQDSPARSEGTKASDSDVGEADNAPSTGEAREPDTAPLASAWDEPGVGHESGARPRSGTEPDGGRPAGGRRYKGGRPSPDRRPAHEPTAQRVSFPAGFGASGTLAGLLAWCLVSCLAAAWLHLMVAAGLGFCIGCALAACCCRPPALLRVVVAVPAVFAVAEILAQLVTLPHGGHHRLALPAAAGTLLTLAAIAPWLLAGTMAAIVIAWFRGLSGCVRDLRAELRGRSPASRALQSPAARQAVKARKLQESRQAVQDRQAQQSRQAVHAQQAKQAWQAVRGRTVRD